MINQIVQIGQRITEKRIAKGINQSELARILKVTPQAVQKWEAGLSFPKNIRMQDIADALDTTVAYILSGSDTFHEASGEIKEKQINSENSAYFHILNVKAACGDGHLNHDYPETVRTLIMSPEEAKRLIGSQNKNGAIQVILASKDSMVPAIKPDDLLFVDTSVQDYVGEAVYILLHGGELVCKRISLVGKVLTVSSDNKAYPSWPWHERPDETKIVGKVIKALPMEFKKFGTL